MDFKDFYSVKEDYEVLTNWFKFDWEGSDEILFTYEYIDAPEYDLHKKHKMVMAEKKYGNGTVILSTLSCLDGCFGYNPVLDKFFINLVNNQK